MNKIISLSLVLALMLTMLVGCGGKTEETQAPETTAPVVETTEPVIEETEPAVEFSTGRIPNVASELLTASKTSPKLL